MLNARNVVANGFPTDEGAKLADAVLKAGSIEGLEIDLTALPASLIISAFFNGFLQRIFNTNKDLLDVARKIHWEAKFEFQRENIARWMKDFKPFSKTRAPS